MLGRHELINFFTRHFAGATNDNVRSAVKLVISCRKDFYDALSEPSRLIAFHPHVAHGGGGAGRNVHKRDELEQCRLQPLTRDQIQTFIQQLRSPPFSLSLSLSLYSTLFFFLSLSVYVLSSASSLFLHICHSCPVRTATQVMCHPVRL